MGKFYEVRARRTRVCEVKTALGRRRNTSTCNVKTLYSSSVECTVVIHRNVFFIFGRQWTSIRVDRSLKLTAEVMENVNRNLESGESKRSVAENVGVPETTPRKVINMDSTDVTKLLQGCLLKGGRKTSSWILQRFKPGSMI